MEKKKKTKRMRELVELLNKARRAYEQENTEIMSNFEYDRLYDELLSLEKELETTLASSPTVNVGYEVSSFRKSVMKRRCCPLIRRKM